MKDTYIPCEYILGPLFSNDDDFEDISIKLIHFKKIISQNILDIFFEFDIVGKLHKNNLYPSTQLIQNKINQTADCIFSAKDLSRTINSILSNISDEIPEGIIEWEEDIEYKFNTSIYPNRIDDLKIFIDSLIINIEEKNKDGLILTNNEDLSSFVFVNQKIKESDPKINSNEISREINISNNLISCLEYTDFFSLYKNSDNTGNLRFIFFSEFIKRGIQTKDILTIEQIYFSSGFLTSARNNQSLNGPFSNTAFETILDIIYRFKSNKQLTPFRESDKSQNQRVSGIYKAYREHITSAGVGLRLMYWINSENNRIEFSRIGPKNELLINEPEFQVLD